MSSKLPATSRDPRIPPKEVMVTRHKSAQMKRQLRVKDRSMKHLTDLLKSPTKETQTPTKNAPVKKKTPSPKAKQSLLKSVEKIQNLPQKTFKLSKVIHKEIRLVEDEEYYPNKRKRKLAINKVVLKPKTAMKVVGEITGSVKRKYAVPLKAVDKSTPVQATELKPAKLSMAEAIRIMDDHLTDEDMMEILTCPSPVWWEDPPDEHYMEDALFTRPPFGKQTETPAKSEPMEVDLATEVDSDTDKIIPIPNLSTKSDKFLEKRSNLEDLLGNIKDKRSNNKSTEKNISKNDVVASCSKNHANTNEIKVNEVPKNDKLETKVSESDDEIVFHNSSMNEDELLKDLENMDIPIADLNDVIVIDDDEDDFLDKPIPKEEKEQKSKIKNEIKIASDKIEPVREIKHEINSNDVDLPKNLPELQKCNFNNEIASPKSSDSLSSKSSLTSLSSKEIDTISDTNVRFVLDDEMDEQSRVSINPINKTGDDDSSKIESNKVEVESKDCNKNAGVADDNVTVYKIIEEISEPTDNKESKEKSAPNEKEKITESKIHAAYKKCMKVYQKRLKMLKKDTDMNKNELNDDVEENYTTMFCDRCKPDFKKVSDDENVKYCLSCSSIFDSKDCTYCINKSNKTYICAACKMKFCCEYFYKTHDEKCHTSSCRELANADNVEPKIRVLSFPGYPVSL